MENVQQSLVPVDGSGGPDPPGAVDSSFLDLASSVHSTTLLDQLDTLPNSTGKGSECPSLLARPTDSSLDQPNPTESRINPDAMTTMEQGIMMDVQYSSSSPKNEEFLAAQSPQSLK